MGYEQMMAVTAPLIAGAEAAAALAARMKLDALGEAGDPDIRAALDQVVSALTVPGLFDDLDEAKRQATVGTVTSFLKQALELIENPGRAGGWVYTDPVVLQTQGQSSAGVPPLIARVAPTLDGLDAALVRDGARILDIGSGVAALSISCCRVWPAASVVGLDPWEPAMKLAAENIAAAGLEHRITLRAMRVDDMTDTDVFDLAWMPAPFLPRSALETGVPAVARSLRLGGWLVLGRYAAPHEALPQALADLRTVRGGGTPLSDDEAVGLLERGGLAKVRAVPSDWSAPIRFVAGQRAAKGG
jgi:methyltransferase family protein